MSLIIGNAAGVRMSGGGRTSSEYDAFPSYIPGVALWLRADDIAGSDGDAVSAWSSREGNAYAFVQASSGKQPLLKRSGNGINGRNVLRFDGNDDLLQYTGDIANGATGTVFAVARIATPLVYNRVVLSTWDVDSQARGLMFRSIASANGIRMVQRNNDTTDDVYSHVRPAGDTAYIMAWHSDGDAYRIRLSGQEQYLTANTGSNTGDWLADSTGRDNWVVGGLVYPTEDSWFFGDIAEILVYDHALSDDEIILVERYLARRYSLTPCASNAASPLAIDTYDGSDQPIHPDVYDAGEGQTWNGYRYWMAFTPYPGGDSALENPSIVASEDGSTWVVPDGLTNPLEAEPDGGFNSDTDIVRVGNTMWCMWNSSAEHARLAMSSTDGVTWGSRQIIVSDPSDVSLLSACVVYHGGQYLMFSADNQASPPRTVSRRTASAITGSWSAPAVCGMTCPGGVWHLDVVADGDRLWALMMRDVAGGNHYLGYSDDGGLTWTTGATPVLQYAYGFASAWDRLNLYRSTFVRRPYGFDVWYTGNGDAGYAIGRTSIYLP